MSLVRVVMVVVTEIVRWDRKDSEINLSISAIRWRNEIGIFSNHFSTKELHRLIRRIMK